MGKFGVPSRRRDGRNQGSLVINTSLPPSGYSTLTPFGVPGEQKMLLFSERPGMIGLRVTPFGFDHRG